MLRHFHQQLKWIPEFYFIQVAVLWFYFSQSETGSTDMTDINFPAILMIVVFHIQLFLNDRTLGRLLAMVVAVCNLFAVLLFLSWTPGSDASESTGFTCDATLTYGVLLLNFIMASVLWVRYRGEMKNEPTVGS